MEPVRRLNALFDALPRRRVWRRDRAAPAFRACGAAGAYAAALLGLAAGLGAGLRPLPLVAAGVAAGLVFFPYVLAGRRAGRGERIVQTELLWLGLAAAGAAGWAAGASPLRLLDAAAPAFALCLAFGRTGCLLAGCCHGRPASLGVVYPAVEDAPAGRAPPGVRLFPVQGVEALGHLAVAAAGLAVLAAGPAGAGLVWLLAANAFLRFGTEGLRGDRRASWLGLSRTRWLSVAQLAAALAIGEAAWGGGADARDVAVFAALGAVLAGALAVRRLLDRAPALLAPAHVAELREAVRALARPPADGASPFPAPAARSTSLGVSVAASAAGGGALHLSLALPGDLRDLPLLCALAVRAVPGLDPAAAVLSRGRVLHLRADAAAAGAEGGGSADAAALDDEARALHLAAVRALQEEEAQTEVRCAPAADAGEAYFAGSIVP